ncbi:MAG: hypothetical protein PHI97_28535 [Desulfobulbus sp.]|nr:hypothetical protein [Desulfobulbus sp.]
MMNSLPFLRIQKGNSLHFHDTRTSCAYRVISVRNATKGRLEVDILTPRVWVWLDDQSDVRQWRLIVRREVAAKQTIKYSLSNAPAATTVERLAYMQG